MGQACKGPVLLGTWHGICGKASVCCPGTHVLTVLPLTWRALHYREIKILGSRPTLSLQVRKVRPREGTGKPFW